MTAKQYLSRVPALRRQIASLEQQIEYLTTKAAGVKGIAYDGDKVMTSPENAMEQAMIEVAELTNRFNDRVIKYSRLALKIEKQISAMENADHVELLTLRYLMTDKRGKQLTFDRIAVMTHRSFERTRHLHGEALAAFQKKYLDR